MESTLPYPIFCRRWFESRLLSLSCITAIATHCHNLIEMAPHWKPFAGNAQKVFELKMSENHGKHLMLGASCKKWLHILRRAANAPRRFAHPIWIGRFEGQLAAHWRLFAGDGLKVSCSLSHNRLSRATSQLNWNLFCQECLESFLTLSSSRFLN